MSSTHLAPRVIVSALRELLGTGKTAAQVLSVLTDGANPPTPEVIAVKGLFMPNRVEGQQLSEPLIEGTLRRLIGTSDTAGGALTSTASATVRWC
jgi:hypothetical protein